MKLFIACLIASITFAFTGCSYNGISDGIEKIKDLFYQVLSIDNEEKAPSTAGDYLKEFSLSLKNGSLFVMNREVQSEYSSSVENVYFGGNYIYRKTSYLVSGEKMLSHKLYLQNGKSYSYNGKVVSENSFVDFSERKQELLNDLFSSDITWEKQNDKYVYLNEEFNGVIETNGENSIKYQITYSTLDMSAIYVGDITIYSELNVEIPQPLKQYI